MSFVIKKKDTFFWPVKIKSPVDGGKFEEQTLNLEFKKLKISELNKMVVKKGADIEFCKMFIVGWKDVRDESGNELPFTDGYLEELLDTVGVAKQIGEQLYDAMNGAIEKN